MSAPLQRPQLRRDSLCRTTLKRLDANLPASESGNGCERFCFQAQAHGSRTLHQVKCKMIDVVASSSIRLCSKASFESALPAITTGVGWSLSFNIFRAMSIRCL